MTQSHYRPSAFPLGQGHAPTSPHHFAFKRIERFGRLETQDGDGGHPGLGQSARKPIETSAFCRLRIFLRGGYTRQAWRWQGSQKRLAVAHLTVKTNVPAALHFTGTWGGAGRAGSPSRPIDGEGPSGIFRTRHGLAWSLQG